MPKMVHEEPDSSIAVDVFLQEFVALGTVVLRVISNAVGSGGTRYASHASTPGGSSLQGLKCITLARCCVVLHVVTQNGQKQLHSILNC